MINLTGVGFASPQWDHVNQRYHLPNGGIIRNQGASGGVAVDEATRLAFLESLKTANTGLTLGGIGVQPGAAVVVAGQDLPGPAQEDNPAAAVNAAPAGAYYSNPAAPPQAFTLGDYLQSLAGELKATGESAQTTTPAATGGTGSLLLALAGLGVFLL